MWAPQNSNLLSSRSINEINIRFLNHVEELGRSHFVIDDVINLLDEAVCCYDEIITEQSEQEKYLERIGAK